MRVFENCGPSSAAATFLLFTPGRETFSRQLLTHSQRHRADTDQLDLLGAWIAHLWERQCNSRAPRLSAGITRVAHALCDANATLAEAYDLLNPLGGNREIRRSIVARIKDSSLRSEWNAHREVNNRYFELIMGSTEPAVAPLVDTLPKRWTCGQNVSFKFEDALSEGWIVLIGAGRSSGSHAQATLMLDSLWNAARLFQS